MQRLRERQSGSAAVPGAACFPDSVMAPGEPVGAQGDEWVSLWSLPLEDSPSPGEGLGLGQLGRKPTLRFPISWLDSLGLQKYLQYGHWKIFNLKNQNSLLGLTQMWVGIGK